MNAPEAPKSTPLQGCCCQPAARNTGSISFIPGGVISGTALIRPDFPELLTRPFLRQQTEYVFGSGSSHYMFLVLAVRRLYGK